MKKALGEHAATGETRLVQFGQESDDVSLPDNDNTASPAKAETSYVNNLDFELSYVWPEYFRQKAPKPQLVYQIIYKKDGYIDAFTGKLVPIKMKRK